MAIDGVVFATGYKCNLSFLDKSIQDVLKFEPDDQLQPILLSKCTFHNKLPNMAFVGVYRGPYFAVMELQAKWANLVFSGKCQLNIQNIEQYSREEALIRNQNPRPQFPHGDYLGLADSLATEVGCLPNFENMQHESKENKEEDELYRKLSSGPLLPTHYRLHGPNSDPALLQNQLVEVAEVLNSADSRNKNKVTDAVANNPITNNSKNLVDGNKKAQSKDLLWGLSRYVVAGVALGIGIYFASGNL